MAKMTEKAILTIRKNNYNHKRKEKINALKDSKFGNKCIFCDANKNLHCHEIHGYPHIALNTIEAINSLDKEDFVRLCAFHHAMVHSYSKLSKTKITKFIKLTQILMSWR